MDQKTEAGSVGASDHGGEGGAAVDGGEKDEEGGRGRREGGFHPRIIFALVETRCDVALLIRMGLANQTRIEVMWRPYYL